MAELRMESSAFVHGGMLPMKHACDGERLSPPISWSGVPTGAQSLALFCEDPDAPRGAFVHWVLFNLPPQVDGIPEGLPTGERELADGARQGITTAGDIGYHPPCPPRGTTHRYIFTLYALDIALRLAGDATRKDVQIAMEGHILAQGELMARYTRV